MRPSRRIAMEDSLPMLVAVHYPRHDGMGIGTCADNEEDDHEERLEIE